MTDSMWSDELEKIGDAYRSGDLTDKEAISQMIDRLGMDPSDAANHVDALYEETQK